MTDTLALRVKSWSVKSPAKQWFHEGDGKWAKKVVSLLPQCLNIIQYLLNTIKIRFFTIEPFSITREAQYHAF